MCVHAINHSGGDQEIMPCASYLGQGTLSSRTAVGEEPQQRALPTTETPTSLRRQDMAADLALSVSWVLDVCLEALVEIYGIEPSRRAHTAHAVSRVREKQLVYVLHDVTRFLLVVSAASKARMRCESAKDCDVRDT